MAVLALRLARLQNRDRQAPCAHTVCGDRASRDMGEGGTAYDRIASALRDGVAGLSRSARGSGRAE